MRPLILLLVIALGGSTACMRSRDSAHTPVNPESTPQVAVDVPTLLPLTIDQLRQRIGPLLPTPPDFVDPTTIPALLREQPVDSAGLFRYRGLAMVASYDYRTRRVNELLLLGSNENDLMSRGKLKLGALDYLVLPVFEVNRPTHLLGLRVLSTGLSE